MLQVFRRLKVLKVDISVSNVAKVTLAVER